MFNALSDFVIFCRVERRLAELTCKAYERDVRACLDFLRRQGIAALAEVRTPDLRRFMAEEATRRPAPSSQAQTVAALRGFFRFCVESEYLERDPAHVLRTPKKRERCPTFARSQELLRLLDMPCRAGVWTRPRRQALEPCVAQSAPTLDHLLALTVQNRQSRNKPARQAAREELPACYSSCLSAPLPNKSLQTALRAIAFSRSRVMGKRSI
jgi:site-specific recombinase XerC